jgi:hypothetical protein
VRPSTVLSIVLASLAAGCHPATDPNVARQNAPLVGRWTQAGALGDNVSITFAPEGSFTLSQGVIANENGRYELHGALVAITAPDGDVPCPGVRAVYTCVLVGDALQFFPIVESCYPRGTALARVWRRSGAREAFADLAAR